MDRVRLLFEEQARCEAEAVAAQERAAAEQQAREDAERQRRLEEEARLRREAEEAAQHEQLAREKEALEQQAREDAERQRRLEEEARLRREAEEAAERKQLAKEKALAEHEAESHQRWLDEAQARLVAEEAAKQKKLEQERVAEQKAREEKNRQEQLKKERLAAEERARKEAEQRADDKINLHNDKCNDGAELAAKKFPFIPVLILSVIVFGGGYWLFMEKSPVEENTAAVAAKIPQDKPKEQKEEPIKTSVTAPIPVPPQEPTPAERLQQATTLLKSTDKSQQAEAVDQLKILAEAKNAEAGYILGGLYYLGRSGVKVSTKEGCKWYKQADANGHSQAGKTYASLKCK